MATTLVDVDTGNEQNATDMQAKDGLVFDGKHAWALNTNDVIQNDVINGEIRRFTLTSPIGGAFKGLAFDGRRFLSIDDNGATANLVTFDVSGNIIKSDKAPVGVGPITFMNNRLYVVEDQFVGQYTLSGAAVRSKFWDSGSSGIDGITNDGKYVYVSHTADRTIYKITTSGSVEARIIPATSPVGDVTFTGRHLMVTV